MARRWSRRPVETLDSFNLRNTNIFIRPGDNVIMKPPHPIERPYIAKIESILKRNSNNVKVQIWWYYRPDEAMGGRKSFHGTNELFLSNHYDIQSVHTIERKCNVYSLDVYRELPEVDADDFFCRFEYDCVTPKFLPELVMVHCTCGMPENPDEEMLVCEGCEDWFHPSCVGMCDETATQLEQFYCETCSEMRSIQDGHSTT